MLFALTPGIQIVDPRSGQLTIQGQQILQACLPDTASTLTNKRIGDFLTFAERTADPDAPVEGTFVIWMSDGTEAGDDGDVMAMITAGGVTKTATLLDFSTL